MNIAKFGQPTNIRAPPEVIHNEALDTCGFRCVDHGSLMVNARAPDDAYSGILPEQGLDEVFFCVCHPHNAYTRGKGCLGLAAGYYRQLEASFDEGCGNWGTKVARGLEVSQLRMWIQLGHANLTPKTATFWIVVIIKE